MAGEKTVRLNNRSEKPDNIVLKEHEVVSKCVGIEKELPTFMRGFFAYLKGNVLPMTRLAYLHDITFFCNYLLTETDLISENDPGQKSEKKSPSSIPITS